MLRVRVSAGVSVGVRSADVFICCVTLCGGVSGGVGAERRHRRVRAGGRTIVDTLCIVAGSAAVVVVVVR